MRFGQLTGVRAVTAACLVEMVALRFAYIRMRLAGLSGDPHRGRALLCGGSRRSFLQHRFYQSPELGKILMRFACQPREHSFKVACASTKGIQASTIQHAPADIR